MKENKKAILEILKKKSKKDGKFENWFSTSPYRRLTAITLSLTAGQYIPPTRSAWFTT